jgi:hypothetical protein
MLWPVAALAGLLLGFVLVYGSIVQSRLSGGGQDSKTRHYEAGR